MSHMAGFGLRACLAVQSFNQIYKAYGSHETITSNCDTTVRFTPNNTKTAEEISRQIGQTSVRHAHRTESGGGASVSEPEVGRPLMTPDEVRRLGVDEVLVFARGRRPIRAPLLQYHEQRYFKRLSAIKAPATSDRTITAPPAEGQRGKGQGVQTPAVVEAAAEKIDGAGANVTPNGAGTPSHEAEKGSGSNGAPVTELRFLKLATEKPEDADEQ
jgi:type IV secretory pathway TraG/TraD family ATPase VirD4